MGKPNTLSVSPQGANRELNAVPTTSASPTVSIWLDRRLKSGTLDYDAEQAMLAKRFDTLNEAIKPAMKAASTSALGWFMARNIKKAPDKVKGLYIHGGVGRGKTMLMDIFFKRCPDPRKRRAHFNDFMADVQDRLNAHRKRLKNGETKENDPIPPVARAIAGESRVICFDEFTVTDIADAMILSRLFDALFKNGVVLVATSNVAPDNLYRDGLNRDLFLPFLDTLKAHVDVISFEEKRDFRLEKLTGTQRYVTPLGDDAKAAMDIIWKKLMDGASTKPERVAVMGRIIQVPEAALGKARFTFADLCDAPLAARDYLAICAKYSTLMIDNVPILDSHMRNQTKRFILLIDALYDSKRHLIISAQAEPDALCQLTSGPEKFEFARTASRLIEMRSEQWLTIANEYTGRLRTNDSETSA